MQALRNQVRPKHQVLVLKCFPRHQKNSTELKPNSSELSYLLYYVSTRRSKLQKVADYLDKRVASDVWNVRIGKVSVSLQILKALIEKCPRDVPLFAAAALNIFKTVLNSSDITMIEETLPTWASFCEHQDVAILTANQDYLRQYDEILRIYASFASKDNPIQHKSAKSLPVRIRFRKAGVSAIRAIADSDSLASSETNQHLAIVIPAILENIYASDGQYLTTLEDKEEERNEKEKEFALRRRQSTSIVPGSTSLSDPLAAAGSIEALDRLAEQEVGIIALQTLKRMFAVVSRGQLRLSTLQVLKFMADRINPQQHFPAATIIPLQSGSWPCMLFDLICGWVPVQDRHVILVAGVEQLVHTPLKEQDFSKHYVLATIAGWLLSSDVNFIGLSVMDVLVQLVQHMQALLSMPTNTPANGQNTPAMSKQASPEQEHREFGAEYPHVASRQQLLSQLQRCVGCLAVHVYYSEQVGDMITAILSRIQPPAAGAVLAAGLAENNQVDGAGSRSSLTDRVGSVGYFATDKARLAALKTIKEIIIWANWTRPDGANSLNSRNPIQIRRWDGTQWLLSETTWEVRCAYVEVLLTWMHFELRKSNLRAVQESNRRHSKIDKKDLTHKESLARRAVSNASQREMAHSSGSTFLALIHVAVYDNAHQFSQSEADILLLHLLLNNLVARLGVNALQHGLPMVMRLQEDLVDFDDAPSRIHIASLVVGYLWATSVHFHFDASQTGRAVAGEMSQRLKRDSWLSTIRMPPMPLEEVMQRGNVSSLEVVPEVDSIKLTAFDKPETLVDKVAEGYEVSLYSPPNSPPTSPNRKFSTPMLEQQMHFPQKAVPNYLPLSMKENMLSSWSREAVISSNSKQNDSHSGSISGSPTANGSGKQLSVMAPLPGQLNGDTTIPSPRRSHGLHGTLHVPHTRSARPSTGSHGHHAHSLREAFHHNVATGLRSGLASQVVSPMASTTSVRSSVRVEDLKRALNGQVIPSSSSAQQPQYAMDDTASESMISYEGSEVSAPFVDSRSTTDEQPTPLGNPQHDRNVSDDSTREMRTDGSITPRPLTTDTTNRPLSPRTRDRSGSISTVEDEDVVVPPVPPLPDNYTTLSPSRTSTSSYNMFNDKRSPSPASRSTRPSIMSAAGPSAAKAETLKSKTVRDSLRRSISVRDGVLAPPSRQGGPGPGSAAGTAGAGAGAGAGTAAGGGGIASVAERTRTHWNANDLLDSIENDSVTPVPGVGTTRGHGGLKPPY